MQWVTLIVIFGAIVCLQIAAFVACEWIQHVVQKRQIADRYSKVITKLRPYISATSVSKEIERGLLEAKDDYVI